MGWRYLLFTLGGFTLLLWALRFFVFNLEESPRYLIGRGHDEAAVAVIHRIAAYNGRTSSLTVDQLTQAGEEARQKYALLREPSKVSLREANYIRFQLAAPENRHLVQKSTDVWSTVVERRRLRITRCRAVEHDDEVS